MYATESILKTWKKFDDFPMETFTKMWFYHMSNSKKQRDVSIMREHREQYGITGNCFDLALWLLDEFKKDGIKAYPIGYGLNTDDAHAAVIAVNENGKRYLCDLGDQWLQPILIDSDSEDYTNEKLRGFFPAAEVQVQPTEMGVEILYNRPQGKISRQWYPTKPIELDYFQQAAEHSQNLIYPYPLFECRIPYKNEIAHWEFYNWESVLSTYDGLFKEHKLRTIDEWVEKINQKSGYSKHVLRDVLNKYRDLQSKMK